MQATPEGSCSPGANGPTGVPPVGEQPRVGCSPRAGCPAHCGRARGQRAALLVVGEQGLAASCPQLIISEQVRGQPACLLFVRPSEQPSLWGCSPGASTSFLTMMGSHGGCLSSVSTLCLLGLSSSLGSHLPRASDSCPLRGSGSFVSFWEPSFGDVRLLHTAELAWMLDTWSVGQRM